MAAELPLVIERTGRSRTQGEMSWTESLDLTSWRR